MNRPQVGVRKIECLLGLCRSKDAVQISRKSLDIGSGIG